MQGRTRHPVVSKVLESAAFLGLAAGFVTGMTGCYEPGDPSGLGRSEHAIIGGEVVADGELPTVGAILSNVGSICTGTLITPEVVLTAAHCVDPFIIDQSIQAQGGTPPDEYDFYFTFDHVVNPANVSGAIAADHAVWHEEFLMDTGGLLERPGRWNDIALLFLSEPIEDHPVQQLATKDVVDALETDRSYLVSGYGETDDGNQFSAGTLTKGMSKLDQTGDAELIAGDGDAQQACHGDSGGPLFADDEDTLQVGIASRINADLTGGGGTAPGCDTGLLYTRVDVYADWLHEKVPELPGSGDTTDGGDGSGDGDGDGMNMGMGGDSGGCQAAGDSQGGLFVILALAGLCVRRRRRLSL